MVSTFISIQATETQESVERAEITVQWYENATDGIYYGYAVKNPASTLVLENQEVKITARDAEGKVLFVQYREYSSMYPGEELWEGQYTNSDVEVASLEITCKKATSRKKTKKDKKMSQLIKLSDVNFSEEDFDYIIEGRLKVNKNVNAYPDGSISCIVTLVLKNGEDIVYIYTSHYVRPIDDYEDKIYAGDDVSIHTEVSNGGYLMGHDVIYDSYEIYTNYDGIS